MAVSKKKTDPFKTRKTKTTSPQTQEPLTPPEEIMEVIDEFRDKQEQAKHFEGEATIYKDKILNYCQDEFSKRALGGQVGSFKVLGEQAMIHYVVQNSSAGMTEEEYEDFCHRWGEETAEDLITKDYASIRFDAKVLEQNYEKVVEALQSLPDEVLENLFKPLLLKAVPNALERCQKKVKDADEFKEMMRDLKIKNYIK